MIQALPVAPAIRFHLSLNVSDLGRSLVFYRTLFGVEPAKRRADYAKFELDDPPLVLSLEPTPRAAGGPLNHLGFRMPDAAALVAMQERLERAGVRAQREEGVECCYARQTKFWVHDPDNTLWEIYTFEGDLEHRGAGQSLEVMRPAAPASDGEPVVWEHRMTEPVPASIPLADGAADEVRLRGTFNVPVADAARARLLAEARRVLKPGGKLFVHVLTADRPLTTAPQLPGPAALVQVVPPESAPARWAEEGGFVGAEMVKFDAAPCFVRDGVQMRETQLVAWKPYAAGAEKTVLYKGPFRQIVDDAGVVYPRGERVRVTAQAWEALRHGPAAAQFAFLGDEHSPR
jgi:catechol 2,3-dioxygenase-like lactoylglutathione lyase family enzyme